MTTINRRSALLGTAALGLGLAGGARGQVERALADAARDGPHPLYPVRWPSGDLREMRARAVVEVGLFVECEVSSTIASWAAPAGTFATACSQAADA